MSEFTLHEVVERLVGKIEPYGDTNIDGKRAGNLVVHINLIGYMIDDLLEVAEYKDRPEYSMKSMGERAYRELLNIRDFLNEWSQTEGK